MCRRRWPDNPPRYVAICTRVAAPDLPSSRHHIRHATGSRPVKVRPAMPHKHNFLSAGATQMARFSFGHQAPPLVRNGQKQRAHRSIHRIHPFSSGCGEEERLRSLRDQTAALSKAQGSSRLESRNYSPHCMGMFSPGLKNSFQLS